MVNRGCCYLLDNFHSVWWNTRFQVVGVFQWWSVTLGPGKKWRKQGQYGDIKRSWLGNGAQNLKWCLTKGWIQTQAVQSSWETEAGWSMELDNIQEQIKCSYTFRDWPGRTALMHHWFRGCWWRSVCILAAQTLPSCPRKGLEEGDS